MSRPFRIPLAGPYSSRISATNAMPNTSGYVGVGVVGLMIVGNTIQATEKDARYINCFAQTVNDPISDNKRVYVVKRPGFGTQSTPASGNTGEAVMVWTGQGTGQKIISAFGGTNSTIYDGTTSLGAITGRCTGITETSVGTTATLTITSSNNTGWYYDTGAGLTEITDTDWPGDTETLAGTFAHIAGFACILTTRGRLWASDSNSLTGWTANSFDSTNAAPDQGVAAIRWRQHIIALGTESMEFWFNAGLTPFPLKRSDVMTQKVGCVDADAITQIADTIWWCGSTPQGGLSIFQWDGQLSRVSTPDVDSILILAGASNVTLSALRFFGRSFVLVAAGATTIVYCVEEKMWHEWSTTTRLWFKTAGQSLAGTMVNYAVSNISTSGIVYLMNHAAHVFQDAGTTYTARVQLPPMDLGTKKTKFFHDVELVCDEEETSSIVNLLSTDNDYKGYTTHGASDLANDRVRWTRLGSSRKRGWVITNASNAPMRLEALEGTVTIGNH